MRYGQQGNAAAIPIPAGDGNVGRLFTLLISNAAFLARSTGLCPNKKYNYTDHKRTGGAAHLSLEECRASRPTRATACELSRLSSHYLLALRFALASSDTVYARAARFIYRSLARWSKGLPVRFLLGQHQAFHGGGGDYGPPSPLLAAVQQPATCGRSCVAHVRKAGRHETSGLVEANEAPPETRTTQVHSLASCPLLSNPGATTNARGLDAGYRSRRASRRGPAPTLIDVHNAASLRIALEPWSWTGVALSDSRTGRKALGDPSCLDRPHW